MDKYCNLYLQIILLKSKGNNHSNLLPPSDIGYEKYWIRKSLNLIPPKKRKTKNKIKKKNGASRGKP